MARSRFQPFISMQCDQEAAYLPWVSNLSLIKQEYHLPIVIPRDAEARRSKEQAFNILASVLLKYHFRLRNRRM